MTQSAFLLFICRQSTNKPGGTYRRLESRRRRRRLLQSNNSQPPGVTFLLTPGLGEKLCRSLSKPYRSRSSAANRCGSHPCVDCHFRYQSNQQTSLEGLIDSKEEEEDYSSPTIFSHRVLHSSSLQGRGKSCVGPCSSPIVVDLQQRIDTGATRVFTATSVIRDIDSGEHEMMTGQPKNTLDSAAAPFLQS
ncbi:hypothetical protein CEXT_560211 [Caerostris extrusa]|uniref:Uncharacterized protein n=1 Tax=Caerostris extrusa TaxID=172846 RepID=A0AAV4MJN1_CAEEX|nr:hypothetical protein CEXT_560211 [Caerostris extrusa]